MRTIIEIIFATVILGWLAWFCISDFLRRRNTFGEILKKEIEHYGVEFISSEIPPPFSSGPFPLGTSPMRALLWAWQYRRVVYMTSQGEKKEAWARLYFDENKKYPEVDWKPAFTTENEVS